MTFASSLYAGSVKHYRTRPKRHVLNYKLFLFLLDLAEIDVLDEQLKTFSRNRFNFFSFYDADFGVPGLSLRDYVNKQLSDNGLPNSPARVQILCSTRMLGYCFNPLSVFYCYDDTGQLFATVYEVHNTRGERHTYVLAASPVAESDWIEQRCEKAMYVSPFVPAKMAYRFKLKQPEGRLALSINVNDDEGTMVGAALQGVRTEINDGVLLRHFFIYPLMTLKVIAGIHYEALQLWLKGVAWFKYLPKTKLYAKQSGEQ